MSNFINNLVRLPRLCLFLVKSLRVQRGFINQSIAIDIDDIRRHQDSSLTEVDFQKIIHYYGYAVPAILGEGFCLLRGRDLTEKERYALSYLGALTGLFDDFFDEKSTSIDHIRKLINDPDERIAANTHELLFVRFYKKAIEYSPDIGLLKRKFNEVYAAQILSKRQTLPAIERKEIHSITLQKGGVSMLCYRSVMQGDPTKDEENLIYQLGGLMQLENDLFDIYKDHQSKIRTLATIEIKIDDLRKTYRQLEQETLTLLSESNFSNKNKTFFMRFICLIIYRGYVCLDELEKSEKRTNNIFAIGDYTRKELICDMENPRNVIKLIGYYLRIRPLQEYRISNRSQK